MHMKNHAEIIAILLSLILTTTVHASSKPPGKDTGTPNEAHTLEKTELPKDNQTTPKMPPKEVPATKPLLVFPNTAPVTPAPAKDMKDVETDSAAGSASVGGTITDEVAPELDKNEEDADVELALLTPVVFKEFSYKEADELIPAKYREAWEKAGLPKRAINNVLSYLLDSNTDRSKIANDRMAIIDYTQPSTEQRLYILNLKTGNFAKRFAAHGKKSGNLYASDFSKSNTTNSFQTTIGFHVFAEIYDGKHGRSYRIDGLEARNSNARKRDIVIHGAMYATTDFVEMRKKDGAYVRLGLSLGCPAVSPNTMDLLLELNLTGALLYNYTTVDAEAKVLLKE